MEMEEKFMQIINQKFSINFKFFGVTESQLYKLSTEAKTFLF